MPLKKDTKKVMKMLADLSDTESSDYSDSSSESSESPEYRRKAQKYIQKRLAYQPSTTLSTYSSSTSNDISLKTIAVGLFLGLLLASAKISK